MPRATLPSKCKLAVAKDAEPAQSIVVSPEARVGQAAAACPAGGLLAVGGGAAAKRQCRSGGVVEQRDVEGHRTAGHVQIAADLDADQRRRAEVCRAALSDGNLSVNCGGFLPAHLGAAVANGAVSEEMIDAALRRTWEASITLGNFDTPNERTAVPASAIDSPEHRALALEAAKDGVTLLKNEQKALPLDAEQTVALVGPVCALPAR